jgi:hypothetical protein
VNDTFRLALPVLGEASNWATTGVAFVTFAYAKMKFVLVVVFPPIAFDAVKVIVYVPGVWYTRNGFCKVEVVVSPKFHNHAVG